jgi:hypothetical protein
VVLGIFVTREHLVLAGLRAASIAMLVLGLDPEKHARGRSRRTGVRWRSIRLDGSMRSAWKSGNRISGF